MAKKFKKQRPDVQLSPRERRLVEYVISARRWVPSSELCHNEFGKPSIWPWNAQTLVTGAMLVATKKLKQNRNSLQLEKVGGGRGGVSYRVKGN